MKRTIEGNQRCWHQKLKIALWVYRIKLKRAIGNSPFMLVYGREARIPISLEFTTLEMAHELELIENDVMSIRNAKLMDLEEKINQATQTLEAHQ